MKTVLCVLTCLAATGAYAQPVLAPKLAGAGFLVGDWVSGKGHVGDTGGWATGTSRISAQAGGTVLLRQDHTDLFDKTGRKFGGFDQIMMIYPEGGGLRAEYADGLHVIHYTNAEVTAGKSVVFSSRAAAGAPVFRLSYTLTAPDAMDVAFAAGSPDGKSFHDIATDTLHRKG